MDYVLQSGDYRIICANISENFNKSLVVFSPWSISNSAFLAHMIIESCHSFNILHLCSSVLLKIQECIQIAECSTYELF
mgnify:CR=1 FL=1